MSEILQENAIKIAEWLEVKKFPYENWTIGKDQPMSYMLFGSANWVHHEVSFSSWLRSPEGEVAMMNKLGEISIIIKIIPPSEHYKSWMIKLFGLVGPFKEATSLLYEGVSPNSRDEALQLAILEMLK